MGVSSWGYPYTINRVLPSSSRPNDTSGSPRLADCRFILRLFENLNTRELAGLMSNWLYQELFGIAQALCVPGSTKMLYCINLIHDGFFGAVLEFSYGSQDT
ncbi:hypothetical protein CFAM422_002721 [Trichoderma lentiforme]|uniref:Uncharacterized protein n=1 Tax=Trichoderma lentiforme TaxID=1567552 RepID=A0A9P5CHT9_9HYPO|nr:hypothetical protein CFAM422_002721 [Trichoderma lentiforme]